MGKYKKYKSKIAEFLSSEKGQRFFNFAYSIGAAIVILGALFKILHLRGGNFFLSLGMGTEVVMFILSAFDNPGKSYHWEDVFPVLATRDEEDRPQFGGGGGGIVGGNGGTVIINGAPEGGVVGGVNGDVSIDTPIEGSAGNMAGSVIGGGVVGGYYGGAPISPNQARKRFAIQSIFKYSKFGRKRHMKKTVRCGK